MTSAGRLLIVNADDFGLTPGVCAGILLAGERGVVTSTSALVVAPAWGDHASALESSSLGVGAHLCAVGEDPPLLTAGEIPTLVDEQGRFPMTWRQFLRRSASGRVDTADLQREFSAQLDAIAAAGIVPTHVDAHQNLHLWPQVARVVLGLAVERGIGAVRVTRSRRWMGVGGGVAALAAGLERRARHLDVAFPETSVGLDEAGHWTTAALIDGIGRIGRSTATSAEIAMHPGSSDDPDRSRYQWGYHWGRELDAACDEGVAGAIAAAGFSLGTFADLVRSPRSVHELP